MPSASNSGTPKRMPVENSLSNFAGKLIQRKDEQVAGILKVVEFHGMQVPSAGLNRKVLFCSDRISHRRALQRGAQIEPPQFLERIVVIRDHPTVLQGRK